WVVPRSHVSAARTARTPITNHAVVPRSRSQRGDAKTVSSAAASALAMGGSTGAGAAACAWGCRPSLLARGSAHPRMRASSAWDEARTSGLALLAEPPDEHGDHDHEVELPGQRLHDRDRVPEVARRRVVAVAERRQRHVAEVGAHGAR